MSTMQSPGRMKSPMYSEIVISAALHFVPKHQSRVMNQVEFNPNPPSFRSTSVGKSH